MKALILCVFLLTANILRGQETIPGNTSEKGVTPLASSSGPDGLRQQTYAIVVGISNYQNPEIPDLQYADRDAIAFYEWLQSPGGGSLPEVNLKLLLNEKATGAAVAGAIDWLAEKVTEGERAIIYFSGHGDVERHSLTQPGFLLCWDTGPRIYMAGGTYSLYFLQEMISLMSVQKKARVLMIADACRSGKLAGSAINGATLTASNLARQYENEIKILSCQPNEYSLEGEQWGGGRGAFSFHLVEGLTGLADQNDDATINLMEIGRYLEDQVSREVAPLSQVPMTIGSRMEHLAHVDAEMLATLLDYKKQELTTIEDVEGRGNPFLLAEVDSNYQLLVSAFESALEGKRYFEPAQSSAEHYYQQLMAEPSLSNYHSYLTRTYAVSLQDDAQQSVNAILGSDPDHILQSRKDFYDTYKSFPRLLGRAAELLGEDHYMYANLKARESLFEGAVLYFHLRASEEADPEKAQAVIDACNRSLTYEPEFPATHFFMSLCYAKMLKQSVLAQKHATLATEYAGDWTLPYVSLAYSLSRELQQFEQAKEYLDKAMAIDSTDASVWKGLTSLYYFQRKIPEALEFARKAAVLAPDDPYAWLNIGNLKQGQYKFAEAEMALLKAIELDPAFYRAQYYLAQNYYRWKKYDQAESAYLAAIALDPAAEQARTALAAYYAGFKRYQEAEAQYLELIKHTDPGKNTWFNLACITAMNGRNEEALTFLEKAFQKGFRNIKLIEEDPDLTGLRTLEGYKRLIEKYFE